MFVTSFRPSFGRGDSESIGQPYQAWTQFGIADIASQ
jgi:hypothetical protein